VPRTARVGLVLLAVLAWIPSVGYAQTAEPSRGLVPESQQCETTKFLIGLRQQGLSYLQEEYKKAYPPIGVAEKAWYEREAILAEVFRAGAIENRIPLLGQADAAAVRAIQAEPDSPRSILWRIDRAQTWYYLAGKPLFEQVLFYGPTPSLRRALKQTADQADQAYDEAVTAVTGYLDQVGQTQTDAVAAQVRQLNLSAFGLSRQLQFEQCWTKLHRAFGLEQGNVDRSLLAGQVLRSLQDQRLIQDLAEPTSSQAEALLMAAIASRLQTDWPASQAYLANARKAATLAAAAGVQGLEWVVFAAGIEKGRLQIDQGQFTQVVDTVNQQRAEIDAQSRLEPTMRLARRLSLAMLAFEANSLAADAAAAAKNRSAENAFLAQRFDALATLAADSPEARQGIYQMVGDRLGDVSNVAGLAPFGKMVFAARWYRQGRFEQTLAAADSLERDTAEKPDFLKQDAIYLKAVCQQELKQSLPAAQSYIQFARDWPQDKRAPQALLQGLSLLARQADVLEDATARALLLEVGDLLLRSRSPQTEQYRQAWLPLIAEANLREARYDRALELFQMIPPDSKQYGGAVVGRLLAVSGKIRFAGAAPDKKAREQAETVIQDAMQLAQKLSAGAATRPADTQPGSPDMLAVRLLLEAARLSIDVLGDADRALQLLEGAQDRWQGSPTVLAQLLNVRIQAMQKAGKLDQATKLVDQFMAARADAAGPLLASLLGDMQREIEQQQKRGAPEQAEKYAAMAVSLAEHLDQWAAGHPESLKPEQRYAIRYRLARAMLQVGQIDKALPVFEELYKQDAARSGGQAMDAGVLEGRADCLFRLKNWNQARVAYMDIWRRGQLRSEVWWQAILRSLQCSAELKDEAPDKILKVIRQHESLYPDMGGPVLAKQFKELSFEMLKRADAAQAGQPVKK
jgi:hypothetical protein